MQVFHFKRLWLWRKISQKGYSMMLWIQHFPQSNLDLLVPHSANQWNREGWYHRIYDRKQKIQIRWGFRDWSQVNDSSECQHGDHNEVGKASREDPSAFPAQNASSAPRWKCAHRLWWNDDEMKQPSTTMTLSARTVTSTRYKSEQASLSYCGNWSTRELINSIRAEGVCKCTAGVYNPIQKGTDPSAGHQLHTGGSVSLLSHICKWQHTGPKQDLML